MLIYKIFRAREWDVLDTEGQTTGSPDDLRDGFIHISTAAQLRGTLDKHFSDEKDLVLAVLDTDDLSDALRWEPSRGGALFPHLYRSLSRSEIIEAHQISLGPNGHELPEGIE
ncbi:DUF952 domain-containing protein [Qingshengfaniella alkalisoli]|uniref:DUF952 domain-containing protein n=2 Tax=Qingshengfaniella alkalisoli TaxID=2599296 RepID=A0A5B8I8T6_9RHOB|nr:DUF952 domain-containing protein [Qingshengfaniella alkalisoli]QDY70209.1 DUF952 domain-containing protein [Qingshengfaniella alkalisoli]